MKAEEPVSLVLDSDVHVSGAVLDVESVNSKKGTQLWCSSNGKEHLIVNLCKTTTQFAVDIGLSKGEEITFYVKGQGTVHLHGYNILDGENELESNDGQNTW